MPTITFEIEADPATAAALLEAGDSEPKAIDLGHGVALAEVGRAASRDFGSTELLTLALSFPIGVAASMVAELLVRRLKAFGPRAGLVVFLTETTTTVRIGDWVTLERKVTRLGEAAILAIAVPEQASPSD
jgi:hypothetical protein